MEGKLIGPKKKKKHARVRDYRSLRNCEDCITEAKKYTSIKDLRKRDESLYRLCLRYGYLSEVKNIFRKV